METHGDHDRHTLAQERAILQEWNHLQQSLFNFVPDSLHTSLLTNRQTFQHFIAQITKQRARIWWETYPKEAIAFDSRLLEMCFQQISYGILELNDGYLESILMPDIPQHFANLSALVLYVIEYEELVQHQLAQLSPPTPGRCGKSLTAREKDMLQGLIRGESEREISQKLSISVATVHTHMQRLYHRLDVHSSDEAILRAFKLRLVDWLDLPTRRD